MGWPQHMCYLRRYYCSFAVNSGAAVFDVLNFGRYVDFSVTAANSQLLGAALVYGEPLR